MADLSGQVAVVTGASRSVGKGVALGLAEAGATVYATGRTASEESFSDSPQGDGRIIPVVCDHTDDGVTEAVFARVAEERGRLDVLVNSTWGGYERMVEGGEFTWPRRRRARGRLERYAKVGSGARCGGART